MKTTILKSSYNIFGSISIGNGLWMLVFSSNWYYNIPAGIPDTGPFNTHFVHDIGLVYLLVGIGSIWCASNLKRCWILHVALTSFITGHALIHAVEIILGMLPSSHWLIDFPLVTFPAILLLAISPEVRKMQGDPS